MQHTMQYIDVGKCYILTISKRHCEMLTLFGSILRGGSAATLGSALAVGLMKPAGVECHWIVAACENMVNGEAMRPGDILTASNGKTIEV